MVRQTPQPRMNYTFKEFTITQDNFPLFEAPKPNSKKSAFTAAKTRKAAKTCAENARRLRNDLLQAYCLAFHTHSPNHAFSACPSRQKRNAAEGEAQMKVKQLYLICYGKNFIAVEEREEEFTKTAKVVIDL